VSRAHPITLCLALVLAIPSFAQEAAPSMTVFPALGGENLAGDAVTLPAGFTGERNLVFLSFARKHQDDVNSWIETADALQRALPGFRHYQVLAFGDVPKPLHKIIKPSMRKTYPTPEAQARYILANAGSDEFIEALGITDASQTLLVLLDGDGKVLWSIRGPATDEGLESLRAAAAR